MAVNHDPGQNLLRKRVHDALGRGAEVKRQQPPKDHEAEADTQRTVDDSLGVEVGSHGVVVVVERQKVARGPDRREAVLVLEVGLDHDPGQGAVVPDRLKVDRDRAAVAPDHGAVGLAPAKLDLDQAREVEADRHVVVVVVHGQARVVAPGQEVVRRGVVRDRVVVDRDPVADPDVLGLVRGLVHVPDRADLGPDHDRSHVLGLGHAVSHARVDHAVDLAAP